MINVNSFGFLQCLSLFVSRPTICNISYEFKYKNRICLCFSSFVFCVVKWRKVFLLPALTDNRQKSLILATLIPIRLYYPQQIATFICVGEVEEQSFRLYLLLGLERYGKWSAVQSVGVQGCGSELQRRDWAAVRVMPQIKVTAHICSLLM